MHIKIRTDKVKKIGENITPIINQIIQLGKINGGKDLRFLIQAFRFIPEDSPINSESTEAAINKLNEQKERIKRYEISKVDRIYFKNMITKVKEIGKNFSPMDLSQIDIYEFIPDFSTMSSIIFKIGWANAKTLIDHDIEYLIKGLHLIELKYRQERGNDFGFGSPSPTHKVLEAMRNKGNNVQAEELTEWVAKNGGNYYITKYEYYKLKTR